VFLLHRVEAIEQCPVDTNEARHPAAQMQMISSQILMRPCDSINHGRYNFLTMCSLAI
jgi:hypothetical protein